MGQQYTEAQLKKKTVTDLNDIIEKDSIEVDEDAKKPDLIDAILTAQQHAAESGNDDDELDDDEVDDTSDEVDDDDEEEDDVPAPPADDEVDTDEEDDLELPEADEVDDEPAKPAPKAKAKKTTYTEGGKTESGEKLLGAKEVATAIGTDAKSLRQFFRSGKSTHFTAVGAGGRYEFKESDVEAIGKEYAAYKASKPGRGRGASSVESKPRASRKGKAPVTPEQTIDEVDEIEDLEDLGDIEEIDDLALDDAPDDDEEDD